MANGKSKYNPNTGNIIVPKPKPQKKVSSEATKAIAQMIMIKA